ncbi:YitT family protein [Traorella massiliensis]|uniref:YitT family protein n=1 Tax=Traorella massiliensis TaxID=1903263 RepID=UPI0008F889AF|nr:YitT family protein [Traorella massiliensis]
MNWKQLKPYGIVILGSSLFALGVNLLVVPLNLYSSGLLGVSQVLRSIVNLIIPSQSQYDWSGYVYFALNIPLYIMAYRSLSHRFFYLSILSTIVQSVVLVLVPIPQTPLLEDALTSVLVGGLIGGIGIGLCLREGGSGGGFDILGMYYALKTKGGSVGRLSLILNAIVYLICAVLFDVETAIYSILYVAVFTLALDRFHTQNIATHVMIFSQNKEIKKKIISQLRRGVTYWHGYGAYTDHDMDIIVTIISKYEISALKKLVLDLDEHAFIVISEGLHVIGNYEKRLLNEE